MFEGVKPNTVIIMAWLSLFVTFYRFGFLVEYLSQATIVGFLAAAAVGIGLQQLKGLFGIDNFNNKTDLFSVVKSLWTSFKNQVRKVQFRWKLNRPLNLIHYNSKFFIINFASCLIINYFFFTYIFAVSMASLQFNYWILISLFHPIYQIPG